MAKPERIESNYLLFQDYHGGQNLSETITSSHENLVTGSILDIRWYERTNVSRYILTHVTLTQWYQKRVSQHINYP